MHHCQDVRNLQSSFTVGLEESLALNCTTGSSMGAGKLHTTDTTMLLETGLLTWWDWQLLAGDRVSDPVCLVISA